MIIYTKINIVLMFLLFSSLGMAQNNPRHTLYLDPLQAMGMYKSSINFGYMFQPDKRLEHDMGIGIIFPADLWIDGASKYKGIGRKNGKGFELSYTPRFVLKKAYLGVSTTYTFHNYDSYRLDSQVDPSLVSYQVKQRGISCYFVIGGNEYHFPEGIMIDYSIGVGIRVQKVTNNSPIDINKLSSLERLSEYIENEANGHHNFLGIKLSVKIGYVFSK